MKKALLWILVICMMLGLCACSGTQSGEEAAGLQVGYGREKIMPNGNVNLSGGGNPNRISTGFLDVLYVTCVAITDPEGNTVLVFTEDLQQVSPTFTDPVLEEVAKTTGVSLDNIMIAATHTHSAPSQSMSRTGIKDYAPIYRAGVLKAAQDAMADRSPATISTGSTQADGLTFVRHYVLEDGTYAGANYGDFAASPIKDYAYEADTELQMIQFNREGKKDVLLMNLGAHATFNGNTTLTNISADFPFYLREYVEKNSDTLTAYFMAAAGDQAPTTRIAEDDHGFDYKGHGEAVGKLVVEALPGLTAANSGKLQIKKQTLTTETNRDGMDRLTQATETYNAYLEGGYDLSDPLVEKYGFVRVFEARAIVEHSKLEATRPIELEALAVGDISVIFAPYEMFSESGRYIKDNSPYDMTFVITQANSAQGYIPTEIGYDIYCYEAYSSSSARGVAETLDQTFVQMLTEMKG